VVSRRRRLRDGAVGRAALWRAPALAALGLGACFLVGGDAVVATAPEPPLFTLGATDRVATRVVRLSRSEGRSTSVTEVEVGIRADAGELTGAVLEATLAEDGDAGAPLDAAVLRFDATAVSEGTLRVGDVFAGCEAGAACTRDLAVAVALSGDAAVSVELAATARTVPDADADDVGDATVSVAFLP
jgi:hypothetical protein